MSKTFFSIDQLVEKSWIKFTEKPFLWICITAILFSIQFFVQKFDPSISGFILICIVVIVNYLKASILLMYIKSARGESVSIDNLSDVNFATFIQYFLVTVASGILMFIGFILLIAPGIYIMARLMFAQYLVLDRNLTFDQAIKMSWEISDGHVFSIVGFLGVMGFLLLVGLCSLIVGLLVAVPIIMLSSAALYLLFFQNDAHSIE
tara:strand:+ start:41182 stop:41799 length:618 start_codon:yes stop_codon:yes gene_type:complete